MGRLSDLLNSPKAQMWGYQDSRRLRSLRLDQEYRDFLESPKTTGEPPDWLDVAMSLEKSLDSLRKEVRITTNLVDNLRSSVLLLQKKKRPQGEY